MQRHLKSAPRSTVLGLPLLLILVAACGSSSPEAETTDATASTIAATTTSAADQDDDADHDDDDHDHDDHDDADASAGSADDAVQLDEARSLLVVAAVEQPVVELIDLTDVSSTSIELESPAAVSSSMTESGRFLLAGHDDGVTVVDTGVWSEAHGDHFDHYTSTPSIVGRVDGPSPTHLISHDDLNALYFDGTGSALVIAEESLEDGDVTVTEEVPTGAPHHGFAVPTHGAYFVTVPTDDMEELPNVVGVSGSDGALQDQYDCPLVHGEASLASGAAAACSDGIVVVDEAAGSWTSNYLPYPQVDDEDPFGFGPARAWLLQTAPEQGLLAAPHGSRHLLVADPANETIQSFDLQRSIATLGVKFTDDGQLVVLTQDGFIHVVDAGDGSVVASLEVIAPFQEGDPAEPFRQIAVTGDHVYVTDPANNQIVEVGVGDDLTIERTIELDFAPGFLTIANG